MYATLVFILAPEEFANHVLMRTVTNAILAVFIVNNVLMGSSLNWASVLFNVIVVYMLMTGVFVPHTAHPITFWTMSHLTACTAQTTVTYVSTARSAHLVPMVFT